MHQKVLNFKKTLSGLISQKFFFAGGLKSFLVPSFECFTDRFRSFWNYTYKFFHENFDKWLLENFRESHGSGQGF
jgi:hypothetical protein